MKILPCLLAIFLTTCITGCKKKEPEKARSSQEDKVNQSLNEVTEMYARKMQGENDLAADNDTMNRAIDAARDAEQSSTGQKAAHHMVVRLWLTLMRDHSIRHAEQVIDMEQGSTYSGITKPEDIDALTLKVKKYIEYNKGVITKTNSGWMAQLKELAEKEGMNPQHVSQAVDEIAKSFELIKSDLIIVRQKDHEMAEVILQQHALLKKTLGSWKWDSIKNKPLFEKIEDQKKFDQTHQAIIQILKDQDAAQARILTVQQGG